MNSQNETTLIAYVASPHDGYLRLFRHYTGASLYVLGEEFINEYPSLVRHLPGNTPNDACKMIESLDIFSSVRVLTPKLLEKIAADQYIVMPDEDVSKAFATKHLPEHSIFFEDRWRLRWDMNAATHQRRPEGEIMISTAEFDRQVIHTAKDTAAQSPDWWRQVGAALVRDGEILLTSYNQHMPSEQSAYVQGDPRSNFSPGESIDKSLALHAEIGIIAEAARQGISTEGCDLYVDTFPCPGCARACARAGFRRLFYSTGYSLIAGAESLRSHGVEIYRVE